MRGKKIRKEVFLYPVLLYFSMEGEKQSEELKLDKEIFRVLSSDTRREILKKIAVKPMTVSELSRSLNINKSAVFNHLNALVEANLVGKTNAENEWVYYELTEKGRILVNADRRNNRKITILLVSSALTMVGGLAELYRHLTTVPPGEYPFPVEPGRPPPPITAPPSPQILKEPYYLIIGISLILLSLALLYYATILRRRHAFKS